MEDTEKVSIAMLFGVQTLKNLAMKGLRMNPLFCSIQGRKRVLNGILGRTRGEQTPINADNTYLVPDTQKGGYRHD